MANKQFDVTISDFDMNAVTGTDAGTVTNDVRVVVKEGAAKDKVVIALHAIADLIAADQVGIN